MEKWQTESLVRHLRPAISPSIGKAEGRGGTLESSSSFKSSSIFSGNPPKLGDDILTCKHSNPTKLPNSEGNKLISFPKNFNLFSRPSPPSDFGIKLNTFLYKYKPSTASFEFSKVETSKLFPETSRTGPSSASASPSSTTEGLGGFEVSDFSEFSGDSGAGWSELARCIGIGGRDGAEHKRGICQRRKRIL